jgi:hypothetical protein
MAKSKRWSMKDIRKIKRMLKAAKINGQTEYEALGIIASVFGVTRNALTLRWNRFLRGQATKTLQRDTTKTPMKRRKRKYTKSGKYSKKTIEAVKVNAQGEVKEFLHKQSTTRELRKMVIDLMNTSGNIKAVSVDLSSKSFTVIY